MDGERETRRQLCLHCRLNEPGLAGTSPLFVSHLFPVLEGRHIVIGESVYLVSDFLPRRVVVSIETSLRLAARGVRLGVSASRDIEWLAVNGAADLGLAATDNPSENSQKNNRLFQTTDFEVVALFVFENQSLWEPVAHLQLALGC